MISATAVICELRRRGVELSVEGDELRYRAPSGPLTADLREALVVHKVEVLALLRQAPTAPQPDDVKGIRQGGADSTAPSPLRDHGVSVGSASLGRDPSHAAPAIDADAGKIAAVKLTGTTIGDCWLVADDDALAEHPDIIRAGLPVFFFDEVEMLRGKTPEELKAIGMVKAEFPTSRVLQ
jgi:hypothetical protein